MLQITNGTRAISRVVTRPTRRAVWPCGVACLLVVAVCGCAHDRWARLRRQPRNPLVHQLELNTRSGPRPTARTEQLLRRYDLLNYLDHDPVELVSRVQAIADVEPTADNVYALAEIAYVSAKRMEEGGRQEAALNLFGTAVVNAYFYLFDPLFDGGRNPYDPRFRRACDLYNSSLESGLRSLQRQGMLKPGFTHTVETKSQTFDLSIAARGTWHEENFSDLKFVSDFDVSELKNQYQTFGLGVPMIAVYRPGKRESDVDRYYPPGMSFPVTAFLRVVSSVSEPSSEARFRHGCTIEFHDPLASNKILVQQRAVPLETDLTTPLAYSLDNPAFKEANVPTRGLVNPEHTAPVRGLYMLEPHAPHKIPVLMVHGFWSSLVTWMEMFNDLRGLPEIRNHYQFWFYLYPTGEPFWYTSAHLRAELAEARRVLDPGRQLAAWDQMILVGHSMGGLIAKMQTVQSGDAFWKLVSAQPFSELNASPALREQLARTFFFEPDHSVRRVITIATPHHGSNYSNGATQWLGRKLINLPSSIADSTRELLRDNPEFFRADGLLAVQTSVDGLSPDSPILTVLRQSPHPPWVKYHNIIGILEKRSVVGPPASGSDGVISLASARLENASSEVVVSSEHINVHRHPRAVLEVRRILLEHLDELRFERAQPPLAAGSAAARSSGLTP